MPGMDRFMENVDTQGRVELAPGADLSDSALFNEDLAPVPFARRTWTTWNFVALWAGMACNIPTYMMSSGFITNGMNWWQALFTILLGNTIVLVPIVLNSHPGTKYGIPFPVLVRSSYGVMGSNLPALMRAIVACGWFGINAWIGGQALFTLIKAVLPAWAALLGNFAGRPTTVWLSFLLFWALNVAIIYRGMEQVKRLAALAAPFVFLMTAGLAVWAISAAKGFGALITEPGKFETLSSFLPVFIPSLTATIGSWATLSLNMPDFTRFSRGQREQVIGQISSLPTCMTAFSAMGVLITSAGIVLFPHMKLSELWDPVQLIGQFTNPWLVALAMFTVMLATLSVNIAANMVSPANDFANAFPRHINFSRGGLLTAVIGLLMQPWHLMEDANAYIFQWLLGYSGGLGAIAGVMIVDYWLIRKTELKLEDLYQRDGAYSYTNGWNMKAVVATLLGCGGAWIGLIVPELSFLYDYAWFVGVAISGITYFLLMTRRSS
jgi:NCS1 family nucleobase:cation symporter-1